MFLVLLKSTSKRNLHMVFLLNVLIIQLFIVIIYIFQGSAWYLESIANCETSMAYAFLEYGYTFFGWKTNSVTWRAHIWKLFMKNRTEKNVSKRAMGTCFFTGFVKTYTWIKAIFNNFLYLSSTWPNSNLFHMDPLFC